MSYKTKSLLRLSNIHRTFKSSVFGGEGLEYVQIWVIPSCALQRLDSRNRCTHGLMWCMNLKYTFKYLYFVFTGAKNLSRCIYSYKKKISFPIKMFRECFQQCRFQCPSDRCYLRPARSHRRRKSRPSAVCGRKLIFLIEWTCWLDYSH